jgi:ketosteroid isomerase-like protein
MLCSVFMVALIGCASPRPVPSRSSEVVEAEIQTAINEFSEASSRGDLAGVLAKFDDQADILLVGSDKGEIYKGRAAIEVWLGSLYKANGFSWQMDRVDISHNGDTAWAFVDGRMNVTNKSTGELRFSKPYRFSVVFVRKENGWAMRLFHGSAPGME